jgi:hypothetical protein
MTRTLNSSTLISRGVTVAAVAAAVIVLLAGGGNSYVL